MLILPIPILKIRSYTYFHPHSPHCRRPWNAPSHAESILYISVVRRLEHNNLAYNRFGKFLQGTNAL